MSVPEGNNNYGTFWLALKSMARVVFALVLRESKVRYGRLKIGYLWAFLEPMFFITVLIIIFTYANRSLQSGNMPLILFYSTGILPFFLFQHTVTRCIPAVRANYQLLTFPQVHMFELLLARMLLELVTFIIVFTLFMVIIDFTKFAHVVVDDYLKLLHAVILISLLGFGAGCVGATLSQIFPTLEFIITAVLLRPLFFLSGIFFTADVIPPKLRSIVLINPMLQLIEMFRSAFFVSFESNHVNIQYLHSFVLCTLFLGLLVQRALRRYSMRVI